MATSMNINMEEIPMVRGGHNTSSSPACSQRRPSPAHDASIVKSWEVQQILMSNHVTKMKNDETTLKCQV
jgi:hypothetical protein